MSKELTKNLMCILMREKAEIWIEQEKLESLMDMLEKQRFIRIGKEIINTADISGIYTAETMEDITRRKNGQWKCKEGNYWHDKGEQCGHKGIHCEIPTYAREWLNEDGSPKKNWN